MSFFDYLFPVKLEDLEKIAVEYEKGRGILISWRKRK
jgi:hypothetical protein